jgi:hypothetical protein
MQEIGHAHFCNAQFRELFVASQYQKILFGCRVDGLILLPEI